jgi:hypothetical protein
VPRIREIKPEFFLDEELAEVSHAARLLFVGLWVLSDREGRLEDRPARIKAQVFPYGTEDCDALLAELERHQGTFITRYEVDGRRYVQIRSFARHQRPHPKETPSKLPAPPTQAVKRNGKPGKETASPESPADQGDPSGGSMGTWAHGHIGACSSGTGEVVAAVPSSKSKSGTHPSLGRFVEIFNRVFDRQVTPTMALDKPFRKRLQEGHQVEDLLALPILADAQGFPEPDVRARLQPDWLLRDGSGHYAGADGMTRNTKNWIGDILSRADTTAVLPNLAELVNEFGLRQRFQELRVKRREVA